VGPAAPGICHQPEFDRFHRLSKSCDAGLGANNFTETNQANRMATLLFCDIWVVLKDEIFIKLFIISYGIN